MSLRTSTVAIETPDGIADAYLAAPEGEGRHPGVIFYMDAFGPRPRLEEMAERLAAERGVRVVWTAVWKFLDRRDQTHKKRLRTPASRNVPM